MDFQKEKEFVENFNKRAVVKTMKKFITVDEAYGMLLDCAVSSAISVIMMHAFFEKHPDLSSLVIEDLTDENKTFCLNQADKMSTLLQKIYEFDR